MIYMILYISLLGECHCESHANCSKCLSPIPFSAWDQSNTSLQILNQILLNSTHDRPNLWMGQDPVNTFKFHWKQREARAFSIQLSWAHSWTQKYLWYGSITLFLAPGTLWIFGQSFVNKPLLIHFFFSDLLEKFKLMIYGRWKLFPLLRQVQVKEHLQLL